MKQVKQPKRIAAPPRLQERFYVGAMALWSQEFRSRVLEAIEQSNELGIEPLQRYLASHKLDAKEKEQEQNWFMALAFGLGARLMARFRRLGNPVVAIERVSKDIARHVQQQIARVLGTSPEKQVTVSHLSEVWREENAALIRNLQDSQIAAIARVLDQIGSKPTEEIAKLLQHEFDFTATKAKFIAVDQTLKLNAKMTQAAHKQLGIRRYKWHSREDSKVRTMHRDLHNRSAAGEIFSYDDPPESEEDGTHHNPGEGYGCRCEARPYIEETP